MLYLLNPGSRRRLYPCDEQSGAFHRLTASATSTTTRPPARVGVSPLPRLAAREREGETFHPLLRICAIPKHMASHRHATVDASPQIERPRRSSKAVVYACVLSADRTSARVPVGRRRRRAARPRHALRRSRRRLAPGRPQANSRVGAPAPSTGYHIGEAISSTIRPSPEAQMRRHADDLSGSVALQHVTGVGMRARGAVSVDSGMSM